MKNKGLFILLCGIFIVAFLASCTKDDEEERLPHRTLIAYMMCDGLDSNIRNNVRELTEASSDIKTADNILVFVDYRGEHSRILKISKGKSEAVKDYGKDLVNSDPEVMSEVLKWCVSNYPAETYSLVIGSHGSGWLIDNDTVPSKKSPFKAIGLAYGNDKAINISTFTHVIKQLPHLEYVLFDCCVMQNVEVAYELRNSADYIIGSPAEIPDRGAPYKDILPALLSSSPEPIAQGFYDAYINGTYGVPISVVKTSELDNLMRITREKLPLIFSTYPTDVMTSGLIYYYTMYVGVGEGFDESVDLMYDMNDFMLKRLPLADYRQWRAQLEKTVPVRLFCSQWSHNSEVLPPIQWDEFHVTADTYGGLSMFLPLTLYDKYKLNLNSDYKKTAWYNAVYGSSI